MTTINPITYPARPLAGASLPLAYLHRRKTDEWVYEPKVNGYRALVHVPTGTMFNREGGRLSRDDAFAVALQKLQDGVTVDALEWLDCEALERRHNLGRGSLVILDAPLAPGDYDARQELIYGELIGHKGVAEGWPFLHVAPPDNTLLHLSYTMTDYGVPCPEAARSYKLGELPEPLKEQGHFDGEDLDGIWTNWILMQHANHLLGCTMFEGYVAKRRASLYPIQLTSPDQVFVDWVKSKFIH